MELALPVETTEVGLCFERREPTGVSVWDSRYGQNYTFDVSREGLPIPMRSVAMRPDSLVDLNKVRVAEDTATKEEARLGMSVRTLLVIRALTEDPAAAADTWADVHVFDASGELIHAGTVVFERPKRTADPALRVWEDDVYQGSGGGPGWGRGPARRPHGPVPTVLRGGGQMFTDGVLHQFEVPPDEDVRRAPGACRRCGLIAPRSATRRHTQRGLLVWEHVLVRHPAFLAGRAPDAHPVQSLPLQHGHQGDF
jgi:hypothetical protein